MILFTAIHKYLLVILSQLLFANITKLCFS
jgi:hypothetical protein